MDAAQRAKAEIAAAYPLGPAGRQTKPGNLRRGVKVAVKEIGPYGVAAQVRSTAPHALAVRARHASAAYITKNGVRHDTGAMPPNAGADPHDGAIAARDVCAAGGHVIKAHGLTVLWG